MSAELPQVYRYFTDLQSAIVGRLEAIDGSPFRRDQWVRAEGGSGLSCILEDGNGVRARRGQFFSRQGGAVAAVGERVAAAALPAARSK